MGKRRFARGKLARFLVLLIATSYRDRKNVAQPRRLQGVRGSILREALRRLLLRRLFLFLQAIGASRRTVRVHSWHRDVRRRQSDTQLVSALPSQEVLHRRHERLSRARGERTAPRSKEDLSHRRKPASSFSLQIAADESSRFRFRDPSIEFLCKIHVDRKQKTRFCSIIDGEDLRGTHGPLRNRGSDIPRDGACGPTTPRVLRAHSPRTKWNSPERLGRSVRPTRRDLAAGSDEFLEDGRRVNSRGCAGSSGRGPFRRLQLAPRSNRDLGSGNPVPLQTRDRRNDEWFLCDVASNRFGARDPRPSSRR